MKRFLVAVMLAASMVAGPALSGAALAAEPSAASGTFPAPAADWLFVQNARAMSFDGHTLRLEGIAPHTIMFTDRPQRMSGDMSTKRFLGVWDAGKDSFDKDPPNASVSVVVDGKEHTAIVEISNPKLEGDTLTYTARVLDGEVPSTGQATAIFIDWWYGPNGGECRYTSFGHVHCTYPF